MTFEVVSPVSWSILGLSPWTWVLFLPPGPCLPNPESVYNRRGPHVYTKTVFACILDCLTLINLCVTWTVFRPLLWSIRYQNTVIFPWQGHIKDKLGPISRKQCVFDVENQNPWVKWHGYASKSTYPTYMTISSPLCISLMMHFVSWMVVGCITDTSSVYGNVFCFRNKTRKSSMEHTSWSHVYFRVPTGLSLGSSGKRRTCTSDCVLHAYIDDI